MRTRSIAVHRNQRGAHLLAISAAFALAASVVVSGAARAQDASVDISTSASDDLGTYLVDAAGMTLYYFEPDGPGTSLCSGDCLDAWPAVAVGEGQVPAGDDGVSGSLSFTDREDGARQATYRGRPLYYFVGDQAAGDTAGHGVSDVWWVASEDGSLPNASEPTDPGLTLEATGSDLGTFITGADGRTTYYFTVDSSPGVSMCADDCLAAWPPVTLEVGAQVGAGEGVTGVIGLITANDGSPQVTYDGRPLYYFAGDEAAGDTNGQGVSDVWWVATTNGLLPEG